MSLHTCLAQALDAAFHLHKKYWFLAGDSDKDLPPGYGVGIAVGEAVLLQPETFLEQMNEVDYVGYPLNCAARLQTLADGYGTALSAAAVDLVGSKKFELLHEGIAAFRRLLVSPNDGGLTKAAAMKGLREADCTDLKYLVFEAGYLNLWKTMGIPNAKV